MAIAVVSTGTGGQATASTTFDVQLTIPDVNAVIFLGLGFDSLVNNNPLPVWDSSGAASSFTEIAERLSSGRCVNAWYLTNPATGTHSITVNGLSSASAFAKCGLAVAYSGVDSTTPYDAATVSADAIAASGANAASQSTAIPSETGDVAWGFAAVNTTLGSAMVIGTGGTLLAFSTTASVLGAALGEWPGAATVASTWAWGSSGNDNSFIAFNVNAAGGGATTPPRSRVRLMGVGRF